MRANLAKALRIKNRVIGELAVLQKIFMRENSRRNDNLSKIDVKAIDEQIAEKWDELIAIKSAITVANVELYPKLAQLAETKAKLAFLSLLQTKEGEEKASVGYGGETITYNWTAYLNREAVDQRAKKLQELADSLQDDIDQYNATHYVELP